MIFNELMLNLKLINYYVYPLHEYQFVSIIFHWMQTYKEWNFADDEILFHLYISLESFAVHVVTIASLVFAGQLRRACYDDRFSSVRWSAAPYMLWRSLLYSARWSAAPYMLWRSLFKCSTLQDCRR